MVDIPLNGQLDTKSDSKLTEGFLRVENATFEKIGSIKKRNAFTDSSSGISTKLGISLAGNGNSLIYIPKKGTGDNYSYYDSESKWKRIDGNNYDGLRMATPPDFFGDVVASADGGVRNQNIDFDPTSGLYAITYALNNGGNTVLELYDSLTGEKKRVSTLNNYAVPKFMGGKIFVFASSSFRRYDLDLNLEATVSYGLPTTVSGPFGFYSPNNMLSYICLNNAASTNVFYVVKVTSSSVVTSDTISAVNSPYDPVLNHMDLYVGLNRVVIGFINQSAQCEIIVADDFSYAFTEHTVSTTASIYYRNVSIVNNGGDSLSILWSSFNPTNQMLSAVGIRKHSYLTTPAPINSEHLQYGYLLASKAFIRSPNIYFMAQFPSYADEQPSYFLIRYDGTNFDCLSNPLFREAGVKSSGVFYLPQVARNNEDYSMILTKITGFKEETTSGFGKYEYSAYLARFSFDIDTDEMSYASTDRSVLTSGGIIRDYDGASIVEQNFFIAPTILSVSSSGGGSITAGTRSYIAIFEYTDQRGYRQRSPISSSFSKTNGASEQNTITFYGYTLGPRGRLGIVSFYRTENAGTVFYKVGEYTSAFGININGTATFLDNVTDANLVKGELLYTTGGVLEIDPPPPSLFLCNHNNRIFSISGEDRNRIYYSNVKNITDSIGFSRLLFIRSESSTSRRSEPNIALASISDKLLIFKESCIYWVGGDGSNELGQGSSFNTPELLTADIGCKYAKSVIHTPLGVMFMSNKGFYLIDGGLGINYIGAPVESYNSQKVYGSCIVKGRNIVNFLLGSVMLSYNYMVDLWSVYTMSNTPSGFIGYDIASFENKMMLLCSDSETSIEGTGFQDQVNSGTSNYPLLVRTGWIKGPSIQGFARFWRAAVLGVYKSAHQLKVTVYYNYDDSVFDTWTITPSSSGQYQNIFHLVRQKSEAISVQIEDISSGLESMELSVLSLEVGVKMGTMKLPASKKS